jgi:hypothetical protein
MRGAAFAFLAASALLSAAPPAATPVPFVRELRVGPIAETKSGMELIFAGLTAPCGERLKGSFSVFGSSGIPVDGIVAPHPEGGCSVRFEMPFVSVGPEVLARTNLTAVAWSLDGELSGKGPAREVSWAGSVPREAVGLTESMRVTLRRFVKVHDVAMGSVGFTKTTVNVSVDVFVPLRFDLRILEASCAVELNGREVAAGKREKVLLHGGQSNRMEIPVTFENGAVLAAAGKTMAKKGKLEGRLKGIGRLKLPAGELDFPFDLPVLISLF